jgi:hypothetical protein
MASVILWHPKTIQTCVRYSRRLEYSSVSSSTGLKYTVLLYIYTNGNLHPPTYEATANHVPADVFILKGFLSNKSQWRSLPTFPSCVAYRFD